MLNIWTKQAHTQTGQEHDFPAESLMSLWNTNNLLHTGSRFNTATTKGRGLDILQVRFILWLPNGRAFKKRDSVHPYKGKKEKYKDLHQ